MGRAQSYGSSFLPAIYPDTRIGELSRPWSQDKIGNLANSQLTSELQRKQIDLVQEMNRELLEQQQRSPELEGIIESYELAFRMQTAIPDVMDLTNETADTLTAYGIDQKSTDDFGRQCLLDRKGVV